MKEAELEVVRLTEAQLLSALLVAGADGNQTYLELAKAIVRVEDFMPAYLDRVHQRIFQAMVAAGHSDRISVANKMNELGTLKQGDLSYMSLLIAEVIDPFATKHFSRLVADNAARWRSGGRAKPRYSGVI